MNAARPARRASASVKAAARALEEARPVEPAPKHTCVFGDPSSKLACPRCKAQRVAFQSLGDPAADEGVRPVAPAPASGVRRVPDRIESLCGLEEPLGDEPVSGEEPPPAPLPAFGSENAPAWTRLPAAQHAQSRRPVALTELDPGELPSSLLGRVLRPFGEV